MTIYPKSRCSISLVGIKGRILTGWYPVMPRLYIYLLTLRRTNTVAHTWLGLWLLVSIKVESQMGQLINRHSLGIRAL